MDKNNIYINWKNHRKQANLSENFSPGVMKKIYEYEKSGNIKIIGSEHLNLHSILNWILRFALTFGLLALNYQWAY